MHYRSGPPMHLCSGVDNEAEIADFHEKIEAFLKPYMPSGIYSFGFSPDDRWMSLKARQAGHDALKKVWPRIGCVGGYITQGDYVLYKRCVDYLDAFLQQRSYAFGGAASDGDGISGQLFCDGK